MDDNGSEVRNRVTRRAAAFQKVREARQSETAEDYVELIGDLIAELGEARLTELAERNGVTPASAAKVIDRLQREGLVERRPYRSLFLTDAGSKLAQMSRRRHRIVYEFLRAIGVDERTAEADAEGMEHHVSQATLRALQAITRERKAVGRQTE